MYVSLTKMKGASPFISMAIVLVPGMYCPRLERLDLSGMSVTQASFKPFTQKCCRIKVSGCHGYYISNAALQVLKCACYLTFNLWILVFICSGLEWLVVTKSEKKGKIATVM